MNSSMLVRRFRALRLALLAGALTLGLAACGQSSGPTGAQGEMHGAWQGTWRSSVLGRGGAANASFSHIGGNLTGTVTISGSPCLVTGAVTGSVNGDNVTFGAVSGSHGIRFTAVLGTAALTGNYNVNAGQCQGDFGTFTLTKVE